MGKKDVKTERLHVHGNNRDDYAAFVHSVLMLLVRLIVLAVTSYPHIYCSLVVDEPLSNAPARAANFAQQHSFYDHIIFFKRRER